MANGKNTPHLDKWLRTFKNVGNGVGKVAKGVIESAAPGITTSAQSIVDAGREAQSAYNTAKGKVKDQMSGINRTIAGKNAQAILNDAFNDIKNGSFSLNKINDSSYDSIDDFDSYIDNISVDASDPDSIAIGESKKNMALLGRTVAEGNVATIQGMQNMTATISNVQIKTSQASTAKMSAIVLTGVNQLSGQLAGINGRLDTINKNLISVLDFQRNNSAIANQSAIEYYSQSSQMMHEMGAVISEMKDFMDNQKSMVKKKPNDLGYDPYDMSSGFDFTNYKELVKNNFKNSPIGSIIGTASMLGTIGNMGSSFGMSPVDMALSTFGSYLLPKNIRKSVERLDKTFTASIDELLYRIGDMRYDTDGFLKPIIGSIFGKKREKFTGVNLGNFKKDAMSWNGVAQKTLVEVIPSYLARIESSLTKNSERFYNMDTGKFMTRDSIAEKYQKDYQSSVEFRMRDFSEELNKAFKKSNVSEETSDHIYDVINDVVDDHISGNKNTRELNKTLYGALKGHIGENELRDIMMKFSEDIRDVKKSFNEYNKNIEEGITNSVYRNLFNEGQKIDEYRKKANINTGAKYNKFGKSYEDLTEEEIKEEDANKAFEKKYNKFTDKFKNRKKSDKPGFDKRMASHIDNFTNHMYDKVYGYDGTDQYQYGYSDTNSAKSEPIVTPIKSRLALPMFDEHQKANLKRTQDKISNEPFNKAIDATDVQIDTDIALVDGLMKDANGDNESSLRSLVLGLYTNFLKPFTAKIFGKNGFFGKASESEFVKKIKFHLFDENEGIFSGITKSFKDGIDYLKYTITGKEYTDRDGNKHEATDNSVFGHLTNGYDFVFKNTMKYFFGDEYKENKTFQKYFSWMDIKGKRDKKKAKSAEDIGNETSEYVQNNNSKSSNTKFFALPDKSSDTATISEPNYELAVRENSESTELQTTVSNNLIQASEQASLSIVNSANEVSTQLLGNSDDLEKVKKDSVESITSKIKKNLPKTLTAGVIGAAVGSSAMLHGSGVLGSLFLPGGPITGAIAGIGLSILTKSKAFQEFLFGKDDGNGNKQGGLISNKMQTFVKQNMPLIVGASAVGAVKGLVKSSVGGSGGFLLNTLLPGGPIGGAVLGLGIALMKNNTKFNKILFGEKAEDGKDRSGGIFSKGYNTMSRVFEKSGNFIKGGLKGAGIGALTGLTIGKLGILGAALTPGGPIGMGIAGLGLGIASQTDKFKDLLFGTKEFDENGNLKGRAGDGLLTRVQNMLRVNVFEPIKDTLQAKAEDFAFYLKKSLVYPFRIAFGPIMDSMKTIKTDISDAVHEAFNNVAETVGNALKGGIEHLFKPFTSLLKFAGKAAVNSVTAGLKMAVMPASVPLKMMSLFTRNARKRAKGEETKSIIEHIGDIYTGVKDTWKDEDQSKYKGFGGRINKFLTHGRDLIQGVDAAKLGYEQGLQDTGHNSANWMNVSREKAADKVDLANIKKNRKQWKKIDAYRREINKENGFKDINYSDAENDKIRKKLYKMGIDKDWIASDDDLRLFFKNKTDWKDKFDPTKNKTIEDAAKNGIKLKETGEQAQARRNTAEYQKQVLSKFDDIVKQFNAIGFKKGIDTGKTVNLSSLKELNKNLKSKGLTWKDIDIDPGELLDVKDLNNEEWNDFMGELFANGEIGKVKSVKSSFVKRSLNIKDVLNDANDDASFRKGNASDEAFINEAFDKAGFENPFKGTEDYFERLMKWLDGDLKIILQEKFDKDDAHNAKMEQTSEQTADSTEATAILSGTDEYTDGANQTYLKSTVGGKRFLKIKRIGNSLKSIFTKKEKAAAEEKKDDYLKKSRSLQEDDNGNLKYESEAVIDGLDKDNKSNKKGTVFDTVKSGVKGFLGSIFNWLAHPTTWKLVGGGLTIAGLYGGKIKEFFDPILSKVGDFLKEKGLPFLETAWTNISGFVSEKLPSLIETFTTNVVNNMGPIIESTAKILWTGISTMFKLLANKLSNSLIGHDVFDVNGKKDNDGQTYETYDEAVEKNQGNTDNIHQNANGTATIMGDNTDIDAEGNAYNLTNSSLKSTMTREGFQFVRSKTNRKMAKVTIKGAGKVAGWVSGLIPVLKTGKAVLGGAKTLATGAYNGGKAIANAVKSKTAKTASENVAEAGIKTVTEDVAKDAAKSSAENTITGNIKKAFKSLFKKGAEDGSEAITEAATSKKGIKTFLNKAKDIISKFSSKLPDKVKPSKFKEFVSNIIKELSEKIAKSDNALIKKISDHIAKKSAEATGRTAANASVIVGLGFAAWDAANGALNASYLFGVNDSDVTAGMRVVSSVMEMLLGTGPGAWIDILLEVYGMLTGKNPKQWFAHKMYKAFGGDSEYLNDSLTRLELETKKYNEANGTNLTTSAYNEKKNSSNGILGRINKWRLKTFNKKKYNEKYDFSKYEVSDTELAADKAANSAYINETSGYSNDQYTVSSDELNLGYGRGHQTRKRTRSIGYGSLQSDSRWANYELGKFPNGTTSTMETGGCGPTALSMIANTYGSKLSPLAVAKYAKTHGYIKDGGSTSGLFTEGAKQLGLKSKTLSTSTVRDELEAGRPVVLSGKSYSSNSSYTAAGHVVKAEGYNNGYVRVSDPMRGDSIVKLSTLTSGMTNGWSYTDDKPIGYGSGSSVTNISSIDLKSLQNKNKNSVDLSSLDINELIKPKIPSKVNVGEANLEVLKNATSTSDSTSLPTAGLSSVLSDISNPYFKTSSTSSKTKNTTKWASDKAMNDFISNGYKTYASGKYKWNDAFIYDGLTVNDLKLLVLKHPALISDTRIPAFRKVYEHFIKSGSYKGTYKLTYSEVNKLIADDTKTTQSTSTASLTDSTTETDESKSFIEKLLDSSSGILGVVGNIFSSFAKIGVNLLTSKITGEDYKSIFDEDEETTENDNTSTAKISDTTTETSTSSTSNNTSNTAVIKSDNNSSSSTGHSGAGRSIGGSSKDLSLVYGPEEVASTNTSDTSNTLTSKLSGFFNDINAIAYAQSAKMMGQDYNEAKAQYYEQQQSGTASLGSNADFTTTENGGLGDRYVPAGYGKIHTYMGWQCITSPTSDQMKLKNAVESYDSNGFGKVGDRYAVAMKPYYGKVGDYLNITQEDGSTYKVALADIKGSENGSTGIAKYVHGDGSMVEFVVDKNSWYGSNKTVVGLHPEFGQNIAKIENVGNYWTNDSGDGSTYGLGLFGKSRAIGYGYSWLQIVQAVKQALAEKKLGYSQSRYIPLTVLGTTIPSVRTDCSGYVSACLYLYGSMNGNASSTGFCNMTSLKGFTKASWMGWDNLVPGDIISRNGHVEIFAKNEDGKHYVFSCGSTSSINNPGMTTDTRNYTVVWRPNENCNISQLNGSYSTSVNGVQYAASTPSIFNQIGSIFKSVSSMAGNAISFGPGQSKLSSRTPAGWFTKTLNGNITSSYGQRNSKFGNEFHRGLDIASDKGTPIVSPIDGTVVSSGTDVAGYGNYAVIRTSDGNNHLFAHMNKPVGYGIGSSISKNDIIGEVGSTGKSTGDHLHYEIRRDGNKYSTINPMNYKYDKDTSEKLNINKQNHSNSNGIGGGYRDLTNDEMRNKLDIALNTSNVETKLDSLIEVMKTWSERDAKANKVATQNNTNITTNNVSYGDGKSKKSTKTISTKKDITSNNLMSIHKAIAAKA